MHEIGSEREVGGWIGGIRLMDPRVSYALTESEMVFGLLVRDMFVGYVYGVRVGNLIGICMVI